jgi:hypothetical protein
MAMVTVGFDELGDLEEDRQPGVSLPAARRWRFAGLEDSMVISRN